MSLPKAGILSLLGDLRGKVVFRRGEMAKNPRKGESREIRFTVDDGFAVLKEKISRFLSMPPFSTDGSRLLEESIYFKQSKNAPQATLKRMDGDSFVSHVRERWNKITQADVDALVGDQDASEAIGIRVSRVFQFQFFLYVSAAATSKTGQQTLRRATASNLAVSAEAVAAFTLTGPRLGPITTNHRIVTHARQPVGALVSLADDNTTRQAIAFDAVIEENELARSTREAGGDVAELEVFIGGVWVKLLVKTASLRSALRLPAHDIFTRGIFHGFEPVAATAQPETKMHDEDHMSDDDESMIV